MALPFLCQVLYSILKIALEYVDLVLDIVCLKMYYEAWYRGDIPWWYLGLQALSLVLPPILMMIYWYKKTEKESVLKRSIAIVGLGLLHALVFPVAAFLKTFPAMQGYEAARHTEDQDMWRIRSLRLPTIMLEHFIQVEVILNDLKKFSLTYLIGHLIMELQHILCSCIPLL